MPQFTGKHGRTVKVSSANLESMSADTLNKMLDALDRAGPLEAQLSSKAPAEPSKKIKKLKFQRPKSIKVKTAIPADADEETRALTALGNHSRACRLVAREIANAGTAGILNADLMVKIEKPQSETSRLLKFLKNVETEANLKSESIFYSGKEGKRSRWYAGPILVKIHDRIN